MIPSYSMTGEKTGEIELPVLFTLVPNEGLVHRYVTWVRTMLRATLSNTKTRGQVRGGGKKPFKQKGTGRARAGSSRSPIWRGGGIVFGPSKARNWATRMPRTERRQAMMSVFSDKALREKIVVLDTLAFDAPKTKQIITLRTLVPGLGSGKILHLHDSYDEAVFASTRNLKDVTSKTVQACNVIDLLTHDTLLLTRASLQATSDHFLAKSS